MDVPDTRTLGFSGPWLPASGFLSAKELLFSGLAAALPTAPSSDSGPLDSGFTSTCMILYFQPGCDLYQIPGEDGNRARILLAKDITVRFIDLMSISAKMDRDLLRRGIEVEVSTIDISFTVCGKVLDEVLVLRLMHLFLRILASRPVILDDDGIDCPVRFCGGGFMFV